MPVNLLDFATREPTYIRQMTIICQEAVKDELNVLLNKINNGDPFPESMGLSPSGAFPWTHRWAGWGLILEDGDQVQGILDPYIASGKVEVVLREGDTRDGPKKKSYIAVVDRDLKRNDEVL